MSESPGQKSVVNLKENKKKKKKKSNYLNN